MRNVGIRSRGLGSRNERKPGLRVDMNRYADGQTFLGEHAFILDNLTQDPSMVRETVTMKLFARLGIPAPRESHVLLYVNNAFAGVYAAVEEIDKRFLARIYGIVAEDTQNDGYLFEFKFIDPWYFTYLGSDLEQYKLRFEAKTKENKSDQEKYGPIEELVRLVNDTASRSVPGGGWRPARSPGADALRRGAGLRRSERRLSRLRRDEQLLLLSTRRIVEARVPRVGRRQRVQQPRLPDCDEAGRERADAEGAAGSGTARGVQQRAAGRDRLSRRADGRRIRCRGSSTRRSASSISCRSRSATIRTSRTA